jgi:hypothetical protein
VGIVYCSFDAPKARNPIKAFPDPANIAKAVVPLLMNLSNVFRMEVVECLDEDFLADYERVSA